MGCGWLHPVPGIPGRVLLSVFGEKMSKFLKAFVRDERGVSAMEYAILAGIIVVALTAVSASFTTGVGTMFSNLFTKITNAAG